MKCKKCGKELETYYYDAGDHFSAGTAPNSGWRFEPCKCESESKTVTNFKHKSRHRLEIFPPEQGRIYRVYCPVSNSKLDLLENPNCCPICGAKL